VRRFAHHSVKGGGRAGGITILTRWMMKLFELLICVASAFVVGCCLIDIPTLAATKQEQWPETIRNNREIPMFLAC